MIYTVGDEESYDAGIRKHGSRFTKVGADDEPGYPGGFALATAEDAERLIAEWGKQGEWAVYEIDADWEEDTLPSPNGWWHALQKTSRIVRKVSAPTYPDSWCIYADDVKMFRVIAPADQRMEILEWCHGLGGQITRCGPSVGEDMKVNVDECDIQGWYPLRRGDK